MAPVSHFSRYGEPYHSILEIGSRSRASCMAEEFDDEMKRLLMKFLKEGISYYRGEKRMRREISRMMNRDSPPWGCDGSPFGNGLGLFDEDDFKRWRKDNR